MSVVNAENLDAFHTAFEDIVSRIFAQGVPGQYQQWTTVRSHTGTSAEIVVADGIPQVRQWIGSKTFKQLRAYKLNKPLIPWEISVRVPMDEIRAGGPVPAVLSAMPGRMSTIYDKVMTDTFLANPTCYDGQALLADAHPLSADNPQGSTYDNLSTSALGYAVYATARRTLLEMTDYEGEPLDVTPTHLMVGPAQEEIARQVTGSQKLVGITDGGEPVAAGGSGVDANVGLLQNYIGGDVTVLINKRITGNQWALMDLSKGDLKPFYLAEFEGPLLTIKDRAEDDNVFHRDEALYSITARATPMAMLPQLVYGSVTA